VNDPLRISPRGADRPQVAASASSYYQYAQRRIRCESAVCHCPARSQGGASFVFVSEEPRFIYFAVPKCATTTILHELFGGRHRLPPRDPQGDPSEYLRFTFVRNPWERMVSNWRMFTTEPAARVQLRAMTERDLAELSSFEAFVDFAEQVKNHHWQPQTLFFPEQPDFVGKLESFDRDFERLCRLLGKTPATAPRRRAGASTSPYWSHYTRELVDRVARMYAADIDTFGYEFADPARQEGG
jgi:hypothetical protein